MRDNERMLTVQELAERLRVSPLTVRRHIKAGDIGSVQIGGPGHAIRIPARAAAPERRRNR